MKIFESGDYCGKTNFIDDNNVFVGFDSYRSCCEDFGYFFSKTAESHGRDGEEEENKSLEADLSGWNFDVSYKNDLEKRDEWDEGGNVAFRLTKGEDEIFLVLYNHHNGYYGHGFDMKMGEEVLHEGHL